MSKKRKKDGRSNPNLKPCPPEEQRYILKWASEDGLFRVCSWKGGYPDPRIMLKQLLEKGYKYGTYVLLSTRPRPKHIATYQTKRITLETGKKIIRLVDVTKYN